MGQHIFRRTFCCGLFIWLLCANALPQIGWSQTTASELRSVDDDIGRNFGNPDFFLGLQISEHRFSENGFDWHLIRFVNVASPAGPMWLAPHDDENAAFDAMIFAIKVHGGVGITVNSGPGSARMQSGTGRCGVRPRIQNMCDPNRNFDQKAPLFTSAILEQRPFGQPIIALHTNSPGFAGDGKGGRGEISIVDREAYRRGVILPRAGGVFAVNPDDVMSNFDTLALVAYLKSKAQISESDKKCGRHISDSGIHFWHEPVTVSDGSMSNYLALNHPDVAYVNFESRAETDLAVAATRHKIMATAYLKHCVSGNKPATRP